MLTAARPQLTAPTTQIVATPRRVRWLKDTPRLLAYVIILVT
jgi:hypothetical protein